MRTFLFVLLVAVTAVLLWAIKTESYTNGLVFSLGLLVTAMCGYLVSEFFFKQERKSLKNNLHVAQKENQALKERADLLQTQFNTATPHAEVEQLEQRIADLDDEKSKIDGLSRAQTAEIAGLRERLDSLQNNHSKLLEDSTVATETVHTQIMVLQDELADAKLKIKELTNENTALHEKSTTLVNSLETNSVKTDGEAILVIQDELANAKLKIKELTDENAALHEKNTTLVSSLETDSVKTDSEANHILVIQDELANANLKIKELTDENTALHEKNSTLVSSLETNSVKTDSEVSPIVVAQDDLTDIKLKIKELTDENIALREKNTTLINELDAKTVKIDPHTEGVIGQIVSEEAITQGTEIPTESSNHQNFVNEKDLNAIETSPIDDDEDDTDETINDYGPSTNLQAIKGIGIKIEGALKTAGISNWEKLSMTSPERINVIMDNANIHHGINDVISWPEQARLLVHSEFKKLRKYQEYIS